MPRVGVVSRLSGPVGGAVLAVVVAALAAGCPAREPAGEPAGQAAAPFPETLTAYVDQSRALRQTRTAFVRLVNDSEVELHVTRAEISSPRFGEVTWTGAETVVNEADLEFEVPRGTCGAGSDVRVRLTYRPAGGEERTSTTTATDRYGAMALFLERDCAEQTLTEAADLDVGTPRVVGEGRAAVYELPVRLRPTGERDDVTFAGFEDTVLFRNTAGSAAVGTVAVPLGPSDPAATATLRLVPTRCDPHALAEDKVGTLVGVRVLAPGLGEAASFHLPIGEDGRAELRAFFAQHCGL